MLSLNEFHFPTHGLILVSLALPKQQRSHWIRNWFILISKKGVSNLESHCIGKTEREMYVQTTIRLKLIVNAIQINEKITFDQQFH